VSEQQLPEGWRWVRLDDVCIRKTGTINPNREIPDALFTYIDIGSIDNVKKRIAEPKKLLGKDAPSRARQRVCAGDIIVSTTRPNLNSVALVSVELDNQICSTGFCVLRPGRELDSAYLFGYVRTPEFINNLSNLVKGAMYPAVTDSQVREQFIPLPPLPEQQRIAAIIEEQMADIDAARIAIEAELEAAESLTASYLREVFESDEAREWERIPFGEIATITAKIVDPTIKEYGSLPHVNGENIESGTCRLMNVRSAFKDGMTSGKYLFDPNDILYSKLRPYLRKVAYVDFVGLCSADMYPIKINKDALDPYFTAWMLVSDDFTEYADTESRRARMPKLNRESLFAYQAPIPPLSIQQQITYKLQELMAVSDELRIILSERLEAINAMPAAVLRRAFSGVY